MMGLLRSGGFGTLAAVLLILSIGAAVLVAFLEFRLSQDPGVRGTKRWVPRTLKSPNSFTTAGRRLQRRSRRALIWMHLLFLAALLCFLIGS